MILHRTSATELEFMCPACCRPHTIRATKEGVFSADDGLWQWNRSTERPTFWPSLIVEGSRGVCHSWIRDGEMHFLADSTHGQGDRVLAMPPWEEA